VLAGAPNVLAHFFFFSPPFSLCTVAVQLFFLSQSQLLLAALNFFFF